MRVVQCLVSRLWKTGKYISHTSDLWRIYRIDRIVFMTQPIQVSPDNVIDALEADDHLRFGQYYRKLPEIFDLEGSHRNYAIAIRLGILEAIKRGTVSPSMANHIQSYLSRTGVRIGEIASVITPQRNTDARIINRGATIPGSVTRAEVKCIMEATLIRGSEAGGQLFRNFMETSLNKPEKSRIAIFKQIRRQFDLVIQQGSDYAAEWTIRNMAKGAGSQCSPLTSREVFALIDRGCIGAVCDAGERKLLPSGFNHATVLDHALGSSVTNLCGGSRDSYVSALFGHLIPKCQNVSRSELFNAMTKLESSDLSELMKREVSLTLLKDLPIVDTTRDLDREQEQLRDWFESFDDTSLAMYCERFGYEGPHDRAAVGLFIRMDLPKTLKVVLENGGELTSGQLSVVLERCERNGHNSSDWKAVLSTHFKNRDRADNLDGKTIERINAINPDLLVPDFVVAPVGPSPAERMLASIGS